VVPIEVMIALGPEDTPDGIWSVVNVAPQWPDNEIHNTFTEDYRNRFDEPSKGEPTGFSYANAKAVRAYEKAAAEAGSTDVEDMIDAMEGLVIDNAPAPRSTIRAGDHQAIAEEYLTGPIGPVDGYDYHAFTELQPVSGEFFADEEECENI
jgi:ABC-type branched-subunit amino acid transport system substrate-binding protein